MGKPIEFFECDICGQYHLAGYTGDCRNDSARYSLDELEPIEDSPIIEIICIEDGL